MKRKWKNYQIYYSSIHCFLILILVNLILFVLIYLIGCTKLDDVSRAMEKLKDKDWFNRRRAAEILGDKKAKRAVPELIVALNDNNFGVRAAAVWALGEIREPSTVKNIIPLLNIDDSHLCKESIIALVKIGNPDAIEPLTAILNEKQWKIPNETVIALSKIGDKNVFLPLVERLKDSDNWTRWNIVKLLVVIKDPRAIDVLLTLASDTGFVDHPLGCDNLGYAIGEFGALAIDSLLKAHQSKNWRVRLTAMIASREVKDPRLTEPFLDSVEYFLSNENYYIRELAVNSLENHNEPRAIQLLLKASKDPRKAVRQNVKLFFDEMNYYQNP